MKITFPLTAAVFLSLNVAYGANPNIPAGTPTIVVDKAMTPPAWALAERELLDVDSQIAKEFDRVFLLPNGYADLHFSHGGGTQAPDDFFECMYKFPLVYALGGGEDLKNTFWKGWQGSLKQDAELGLFKNDMAKYLDWHHNGEHYMPFWMLGLCMPNDPEYRRLALKYASLYDGTNPDVPNYDPNRRIIRSMNSGGAGPILKAAVADWNTDADPNSEFWLAWTYCGHDGPVNLVTTCFGTTAFLLTGDPNYKQRTMDYINAWRDRAKANGGIVPSIVNLDGNVPAEWWGGVMGWDFKQFGGLFQVSSGPKAAWGNALLMTGDASYYDEMRAEADEIWAHRFPTQHKGVKPGTVDLPRYRGKDGWYGDIGNGVGGGGNSAGLYSSLLANLYLATMSKEDLQRILDRPVQGLAGHAGYHEGGYEPDWIRFLIGQNPTWPETALKADVKRAQGDLARLQKEKPATEVPVRKDGMQVGWCGALVNCMTGGIMPLWHGQLLLGRFFYFDPQRKRPGISEDCAALIDSLCDDGATLTLINMSKDKTHTVLVQTGAYGEHQCLSVQPEGGKEVPVNGTLFAVELKPGSGQKFTVKMKRYANTPTLRQPWGRQ